MALDAFSKDIRDIDRVMTEHLPGLAEKTNRYVFKFISAFVEVTYTRGQRIFSEGESSDFLYFIAEGEVRLTNHVNPFSVIEADRNQDANLKESEALISKGLGAVSQTICETQFGIVAENQWVCEEYAFYEAPIVYSGYANSATVKVLRITNKDFMTITSEELRKQMEKSAFTKLEAYRDKL